MKAEMDVGMTRSMESKSDANLDVIRPLSVTWKNAIGAPITCRSRKKNIFLSPE